MAGICSDQAKHNKMLLLAHWQTGELAHFRSRRIIAVKKHFLR
jgi:hypothetical protein